VVRQRPQIGISVRERSRYLQAVAHQHTDTTALAEFDDDAWATRFGVVEPGAFVHPSAVIHDSVVLAGARVAAGAAVIHSVLCASASVAAGQVVRNSVIA
jgi:ADP-glucose pyrophosphorylase